MSSSKRRRVSEYHSVLTADNTTPRCIPRSRFARRSLDGAGWLSNRAFYFYLSPADDHCFHSPMAGLVERFVDLGHLPRCSASVKSDLMGSRPSILLHNRRCLLVLRNGDGFSLAMVIVGGFLVDSLRIDASVREGAKLEKGQFVGSFALGGSAVVMLTDGPGGGLELEEGLREAMTGSVLVKINMGRDLGRIYNSQSVSQSS